MRRLGMAVAVVLLWLNVGCIKRDSGVTWYVDPGGQVLWSILEVNIRSDAASAADRGAEEAKHIANVRSQMHGAARGLARLGAAGLKVTILQDRPPFAVLTEGRFPGLDELGARVITRFGLSGSSQVVRDGNTWTWTMTMSDPKAGPGPESDGGELVDLMGDRLTVALREGRFLSATGFVLDEQARTATLMSDDKLTADDNGVLRIQLSWEIK
jgi:hypothetical protein